MWWRLGGQSIHYGHSLPPDMIHGWRLMAFVVCTVNLVCLGAAGMQQ